MRIFEIILFEYLLGYILQGFAYCLGIYAFCVRKVELRKYTTASLIFIIISYIMRLFMMRLLPDYFGVHTILNLVCLFLIGIFFLKIPALATIRSILAITVLLLMTELVSVFCITKIVGQAQFDSMMNDNLGKAIIALPSSVIFAGLVVAAYFILRKIKKKSVKNGESGA